MAFFCEMKKLVLLYCSSFILLGSLDVWTTYVGFNRYDAANELNPLVDPGSLWSLTTNKIIGFVILLVLLLIGIKLNGNKLRESGRNEFSLFYRAFSEYRIDAFANVVLLVLPISLALLHFLPVINNIMYIGLGVGLFVATAVSVSQVLGISVALASAILYAIVLYFAFKPIVFIIYRLVRVAK